MGYRGGTIAGMTNPFKLAKVKQTAGTAGWGGLIDRGRQWGIVIPGEESSRIYDTVADGFRKEAQAKLFLAGLEMGWDWGSAGIIRRP